MITAIALSLLVGGCEVPPGCTEQCLHAEACWIDPQNYTWPTPIKMYLELGTIAHLPECCNTRGSSLWARCMPDGPWNLITDDIGEISFGDDPFDCTEYFFTMPSKLSETIYEYPGEPGKATQIVKMYLGDHPDPPEPTNGGTSLTCPPTELVGVSHTMNAHISGWCPADFTHDNTVGTADLILLYDNFGDPFDTADLLHLLGRWGSCSPSEP
jgi:hypothetical protein